MRWLIGSAVLLALTAVAVPVLKWLVHRQIRNELNQFVRSGTLDVDDISVSPKRRQVRIRGVSVLDADRVRVAYLAKIDIDIRRIHHRHVDASMTVFDPVLNVDLDRIHRLAGLFRPEVFLEEGPLALDRIDVHGGKIVLAPSDLLADSEILFFEARGRLGEDTDLQVDLRATGPLTSAQLRLAVRPQAPGSGPPLWLEGSGLVISSRNLPVQPKLNRPSETAPAVPHRLQIHVTPADTGILSMAPLRLNAAFAWGPVKGLFRGLRASADTTGIFWADDIRMWVGPEGLACSDNELDVRQDQLRLRSDRWVRIPTGLTVRRIDLRASRDATDLIAYLETAPLSFRASWNRPPTFSAAVDSFPIAVLFRELGESLPVSGDIRVDARAQWLDTELTWDATVVSSDARIGPAFGKISVRSNLHLKGIGMGVDEVSGTVEPSVGIPIRVTGKNGPRGFSGRASLRDRSIKDIQILGESFGREVPIRGASGQVGLDIDYTLDRRARLFARGRLRLTDGQFEFEQYPFQVEGLSVDMPFEYSPDTSTLVVSDASTGEASARRLAIGPYEFLDCHMVTASKGNKLYIDVPSTPSFGGVLRARLLLQLNHPPQQQLEFSVDSVSLRQILDPYVDARGALSGLVSGEARLLFHGDLVSARGTAWARATDRPGDPMVSSRTFLEKIGGAAIRKLDLPRRVPYRNGFLKVRVSDGRIWFDEVTLEAHTLLRKVRIGKVVGSYRMTDLVDVLSNVSADEVKVEVGGKKRK